MNDSGPQPWVAGDGPQSHDPRRHAPATLRNGDAILAALRNELPTIGTVLEVASGSGEHLTRFAAALPDLDWQPSDPDPAALNSIAAYRADVALTNIAPPLTLDATASVWPLGAADAILCINMIHISPWAATHGLFAGAAQILPAGAPLIAYGAFVEADVPTAESNVAFDHSLRSRNPEWGLRNLAAVDEVATAAGFARTRHIVMPANNLLIVWRRL